MTDPRHARIETMLSALLSAFARDIERAWRMGTDSEAVAKLEKETASRIFSALAESGADGRVRESAESLLRYINEAMDECPFCDMPDEQHDPDCRCGMLEAALSAPNPPVSSESSQPAEKAPTPMILHCPECRTRHIDEGDFATKVHHTHSCQGCGLTWRPAVVPTVGVQFLPGFKNEPAGANPPNSSNSSHPAEKADCPECHHAIARAVERAPLHDDGYIAQCEVCGKRHERMREELLPIKPNGSWRDDPRVAIYKRHFPGALASEMANIYSFLAECDLRTEHPDTIALRELREAIDRNFKTEGAWKRILAGETFYASPPEPPRQTIRQAIEERRAKVPYPGQLDALIEVLDERFGRREP